MLSVKQPCHSPVHHVDRRAFLGAPTSAFVEGIAGRSRVTDRSHSEPGTFEHQGKIIIVGGRSNNTKEGNPGVAHITEYDPKTDQGKELPPLPVRLLAPAASILDGKLIVIAGGMNNTQPVQLTTWIQKQP